MKNKAIAFLLAIAMVLTVSACGGGSNVNAPANQTTNTTDQQSETPTNTPTQPAEPPKQEQNVPSGTVMYEGILFHLDKENAYYVCEIENTGTMPITFDGVSLDVEDANGNIINVVEYVTVYPQVAIPGEKAYIFERILSALTDNVADVTIANKVVLHGSVYAAAKRDVDLDITQISLNTDGYTPEIIGRIKNNGNEQLDYVQLSAPLFLQDGTICGLFHTTIELKPGEEKGFSADDYNADRDANYSDAVLGPISIYVY